MAGRRIWSMLMVVVIIIGIVSFPVVAHAADGNLLFNSEEQEELNREARKNRMESQTGSMINSISEFIIDFLHLKDLVTLVYMRPVNYEDEENVDTWVDKYNRNDFLDRLYAAVLERYRELMKEHPILTDGSGNIYSHYDFLFPFELEFEHTTYRVNDQMVGIIGGENGLLFRVKSIETTEFPADLAFGLFPKAVTGILATVLEGFHMISVYLLIGIIVIAGLMMLLKSSSQSVLYFKEVVLGILMALAVLMFTVSIIKILGDWNRLGVNLAYAMLDPEEQGTSFINMLYNRDTASLGMAIVSIIAVFMIAAMNFQYMVRLISLVVLTAMSPVVAVFAIFPSKREALSIWFNEMLSNIFMQTCHAFALTFFLKLVNSFAGDPDLKSSTFWIAMAGVMGLNTFYALVRSMLGLAQFNSKSTPGMMGNMLGLGAMLGLGRFAMAFSGKKDKNVQAAKDTAVLKPSEQVQKPGTVKANSTTPPIAGMFSGFKEPLYSAVGSMLKKGLKTGSGIAGGALLGMTGGIITAAAGQDPASGFVVGAEVGNRLGGKVGSSIGSMGSFASQIHVNDGLKNYLKNKSGFFDNSQYRDVQEMMQMGRNLTGGEAGAVIGEMAGRLNRFRAENMGSVNSSQANEMNAIDNYKDEKGKLQELAATRKDNYELEKVRMEAARAKLTSLQPDSKRGRKSNEVRKAMKEYSDQKQVAAKAEQLYKETLGELKEHDTLEFTLKDLAKRSGRKATNGFN